MVSILASDIFPAGSTVIDTHRESFSYHHIITPAPQMDKIIKRPTAPAIGISRGEDHKSDSDPEEEDEADDDDDDNTATDSSVGHVEVRVFPYACFFFHLVSASPKCFPLRATNGTLKYAQELESDDGHTSFGAL